MVGVWVIWRAIVGNLGSRVRVEMISLRELEFGTIF